MIMTALFFKKRSGAFLFEVWGGVFAKLLFIVPDLDEVKKFQSITNVDRYKSLLTLS